MEVYARELLPRLAALPGLELVAIVSRRAAEDRDAPWNGGSVRSVLAPVDAQRPQAVGVGRAVARAEAGDRGSAPTSIHSPRLDRARRASPAARRA